MKKIVLVLLVLFSLIQTSFAFEVFDENDLKTIYFSQDNSKVIVKSNLNLTNLSVTLQNNTQIYSESICGNNYCYEFDILDLISDNNLSLISSNINLNLNSETEEIYFDLDKPNLEIINNVIDSNAKELKVYFNYSDNYEVEIVGVYEKVGSSLNFLANTSLNTYTKKISSSSAITLVFKIFDKAKNFREIEKTFSIDDIFKPKILSTKLFLEDDKYEVYFRVQDDNLDRYEFVQDDLILKGITSSTVYENTIVIPFNSGKIEFKIYDDFNNYETQTLLLESPISNSYENKYSNEKKFEFESNANNCYLIKVDSQTENEKFDKDKDDFSIDLDVEKNKEIDLEFYCENSNFREYFSRSFFYDTNTPSSTSLNIEKLSNGNLKINWDEAKDNESQITYNLYRDEDRIYSGLRTSYIDDEVTFPNSYQYYIKVEDEAKNFVKTSLISEIPKKVDVNLKTNLEKEQISKVEEFELSISTDVNSQTDIIVKNKNAIIYSSSTKKENDNIKIPLEDGVNNIIIKSRDEFGNEVEKSYFITYNKPITMSSSIKENKFDTNSVNSNLNNNLDTDLKQTSKEIKNDDDLKLDKLDVKDSLFWYWIIFWIFVIGIFTWYFIFSENRIKQRLYQLTPKNLKKKNNSTVQTYLEKRNRDHKLKKNLEKIKKERREREIMISNAKKREEAKAKRTPSIFEEEKKKNLSNKKKDLSFNERTFNREKLRASRQIHVKKEKFSFFKNSLKKIFSKKETEKEDLMLNYIQKQKLSDNWSSTNFYRQSYHDKLKAKEEEKKRKLEEEKKLQQLETEKKTQEELIKKQKREAKLKKESDKKTGLSDRKSDKLSLDDYLSKRKKKRSLFFAEREVEKDIKKNSK